MGTVGHHFWVALGGVVRPYHLRRPVVLEVHGYVHFAGLLAPAHLGLGLAFPPGWRETVSWGGAVTLRALTGDPR